MADRHVYFAIENLALTAGQKSTLWTHLRGLGVFNTGPKPQERNHWRIRLDNDAAIHEAVFDDSTISITAIKNWLASTFGVSAASIDHANQTTDFSGAGCSTRIVTFSRTGTDYIRMAIMGYTPGNWPTWPESRVETVAYIAAYAAEWETVEP